MGTAHFPRSLETTGSLGIVNSQLGNCVTTARIQQFLCLLTLVLVAAIVGYSPVIFRILAHISLSLSTSRADEWCREFWWDTWYSWIFIGGPPGRYVVGSFLGFRLLGRERGSEGSFPGSIIELPHLRVAIMFVFTVIFVVISVVRLVTFQRVQTIQDNTGIRLSWFPLSVMPHVGKQRSRP